jgi:hypothetical protein
VTGYSSGQPTIEAPKHSNGSRASGVSITSSGTDNITIRKPSDNSTARDGRQHVKLLATNIFGFEDLLASQGSDWDFNDTKIRVSVSA